MTDALTENAPMPGEEPGGMHLELPVLAPLFTLDRWVMRLEVTVLGLLLAGMIGLGLGQVVMREFLGTGLPWADGLVRNLVLATGMIGAMSATHARRHLAMDALVRILPAKARQACEVAVQLLSAGTCFWLVVLVVPYLREEMANGGEPVALGLTQPQFQVIFPIAFLGMGLRFGLHALNDGLLLAFPRAAAALRREQGAE